MTARRPTMVEMRCPPISARACAGSAFGEPRTITIEVANDAIAKAQRVVDLIERAIAGGLGKSLLP